MKRCAMCDTDTMPRMLVIAFSIVGHHPVECPAEYCSNCDQHWTKPGDVVKALATAEREHGPLIAAEKPLAWRETE